MIHLDETIFISKVLAVVDGERATLQAIQKRSGRRGLYNSAIVATRRTYSRNAIASGLTSENVIALPVSVFSVSHSVLEPRRKKLTKLSSRIVK